jgi:peroxiredoxin
LKLNSEKPFLIAKENGFDHCTWQQLTSNRRILICSVTRPQNIFLPVYARQLCIWSYVYKSLGVDQTYLVTEDNKITALWTANFSQDLDVLCDLNNEFVEWLAKQALHDHGTQFLGRYWNYQVLINNGHVEKLYQQPTDNLLKHFVRDTGDIPTAKAIKAHEQMLFTPLALRKDLNVSAKLFYYRLHPNIELKNYLLNQKQIDQ